MIEEIRTIIRNRNQSPRGVDTNVFISFDATANEADGIKATPENINSCANEFLNNVMERTQTLVEHCYRMTTLPGDVAKALDSFAQSENYMHKCDIGDDAMENTDNLVEIASAVSSISSSPVERVRGAHARAAVGVTDEDYVMEEEVDETDDDEEVMEEETDEEETNDEGRKIFIDSEVYDERNTLHPVFDEMYPPIETMNLTDEQFKSDVLPPFLNRVELGNGVPCAECEQLHQCGCVGRSDIEMVIVGMLKSALYAYLAAKLA